MTGDGEWFAVPVITTSKFFRYSIQGDKAELDRHALHVLFA